MATDMQLSTVDSSRVTPGAVAVGRDPDGQSTRNASVPQVVNAEKSGQQLQPAELMGRVPIEGDASKAEKEKRDQELEKATSDVEAFLQSAKRGLKFHVDEDAGRTVVKVMDVREEKVIRQIPTEEVLMLAEKIRDLKETFYRKTGMLLDSRA